MYQILKASFLYLPLIFAGTSHLILAKSSFLNLLKKPMDDGYILADGRRLLGDNKTWKGFIGMTVFTASWFCVFGCFVKVTPWAAKLSLFPFVKFESGLLMLFYGMIWGLSYVVFELPNSFIKRRLDIGPGQKGKGLLGAFFVLIDQADSIIGCAIGMLIFYVPDWGTFWLIILMGIVIHYVMNIIFFLLKLKRRIG